VREASNFYKINPERIVVFHDDIDLAFGDVKLKKGGSNAGHNGLVSIDENIGTNYVRLRVGISHPGEKEKVNSHVLGDFTKEEYESFEKILSKIHKNFDLIIDGNIKKFQSSMK
jgi:PTH1 family peptidyl-tRNA hydrolase